LRSKVPAHATRQPEHGAQLASIEHSLRLGAHAVSSAQTSSSRQRRYASPARRSRRHGAQPGRRDAAAPVGRGARAAGLQPRGRRAAGRAAAARGRGRRAGRAQRAAGRVQPRQGQARAAPCLAAARIGARPAPGRCQAGARPVSRLRTPRWRGLPPLAGAPKSTQTDVCVHDLGSSPAHVKRGVPRMACAPGQGHGHQGVSPLPRTPAARQALPEQASWCPAVRCAGQCA